ncbi:hypothetical protein LX32DRAFT_647317 [Colletotrichum zoysiae]|uniref:Uncharacterized protein n=1 Tax=Colletotrichum zoysiae TaxID=1216348 RepID=A0AAD9LSW4_9PEZI|nr:hypothetical protein LX32DRAFT_647317 [Colletotrichum zoysiae]
MEELCRRPTLSSTPVPSGPPPPFSVVGCEASPPAAARHQKEGGGRLRGPRRHERASKHHPGAPLTVCVPIRLPPVEEGGGSFSGFVRQMKSKAKQSMAT